MADQLPRSGWFEPPGLERPEYPSHIHYVHLPPPLDPSTPIKIAGFALNHVLVRPSSGQRFANLLDPTDWAWNQGEHTRKALRDLHQAGWKLVVFGNELGVSWDAGRKVPMLRSKIEGIAQSLGLPIRFMLALKKDSCRLPDTEMFDGLDFFYERNSVKIDRQNSFFCGNAAGRPGDYAHSDRQLATNIGVHFVLPEQCFSPNFLHHQLPALLATPILPNPRSLAIAHGALQRMPRNLDDDSESETVAFARPSSEIILIQRPRPPQNPFGNPSPPPPPVPRPSSSSRTKGKGKAVPSAPPSTPIDDESDRPLSTSLGVDTKTRTRMGQPSSASSSSRNVLRRAPKPASKKPRRRASTSSSSSSSSTASPSSSSSDTESTASSSESTSSDEKSMKRKRKQPVVARKQTSTEGKGKEREIVDLDSDEPLSFQRSRKGRKGAALEEEEEEDRRRKKGKGKGKEGK